MSNETEFEDFKRGIIDSTEVRVKQIEEITKRQKQQELVEIYAGQIFSAFATNPEILLASQGADLPRFYAGIRKRAIEQARLLAKEVQGE